MDGISGLKTAQAQTSVGIKVQKQTQDMVKQQAAQLLNSLPQAANMPGMGGRIDVTG